MQEVGGILGHVNYSLSYQNVVKISKCDKLSEVYLLTHGVGFRDAITAKKKIEQLYARIEEEKEKGPSKIGGQLDVRQVGIQSSVIFPLFVKLYQTNWTDTGVKEINPTF